MVRGSPIGFSGSGIWAFWSPRFRILKKYGSGIRDCIYGRYVGFSVITKRDPGNRHFEAPRSGISDGGEFKINPTFAIGNDGNADRNVRE